MALAGRSDRRRRASGTGLRWLAVGLVITLLVLLIDASLNSRSPAPEQQLAAGAWVDRALQAINSSTAEGQVVAGVWSSGLKTPPSVVAGELQQVADGAAADYQAVLKLRPPPSLAGSAGLLDACLLARSQAAAELNQAFTATLGSAATMSSSSGSGSSSTSSSTTTTVAAPAAPPAAEAALVSQAGADIQVGDSAYRLFLRTFPASVGVKMPPSAWGSDAGPYQPQAAAVFLASLQSAAVTGPVHRVRVYSITTSPAPVSHSGGTEVIPDASDITVTIVVANTGNQAEDNLTVTAAISPSGSGTSSVRDFVNLQPGQAYTISSLGPLMPPQGPPVTLTVTVSPPSGSATPSASADVVFQMPAPTPPSSSTSSTSTPSTSSSTSTPPTT